MWLNLFTSILVTLSVVQSVEAGRPLAHCQTTRIPVELLREQVNVVYTMKHGCRNCYKEAFTFPSLKQEMAIRGIDINVVVGINRSPRHLISTERLLAPLKADYGRVWTALGGENGHVFIIDKCGRLIYQVITPWALSIYPYVKAAILATQNDNPCGSCKGPLDADEAHIRTQETEYPAIVQTQPINDVIIPKDGTVPLRVVFAKRHTHAGCATEYKLVELQTGNPSYHGHPDLEHPSSSNADSSTARMGDEKSWLAVTGSPLATNLRVEGRLKSDSYVESGEDTQEVVEETEEDDGTGGEFEEENKEKLKEHYRSLLTWLQYV